MGRQPAYRLRTPNKAVSDTQVQPTAVTSVVAKILADDFTIEFLDGRTIWDR
jgi:hypothetical protein